MATWVWVVLAIIHFLPWLEALCKAKRNSAAIGALNLFLGWTVIGWIAALIWALAEDAPEPRQS